MEVFHYTMTHFPSGKSFKHKVRVESMNQFHTLLVSWNKSRDYKYTSDEPAHTHNIVYETVSVDKDFRPE